MPDWLLDGGIRAAGAGTDPLGTTCTYTNDDTKLTALVTDDAGLADIEPRTGGGPAVRGAAGPAGGRRHDLFAFRGIRARAGLACENAEVVAAEVLTSLIDKG